MSNKKIDSAFDPLAALYGPYPYMKMTGEESLEELFKINGYVKFAELMRALGVKPQTVRNKINQERNSGVDVDAKYGIRRSPGVKPHLYIRPCVFGEHFDRFKHLRVKTPVKKLPSQVSKQAFVTLEGVYRLSDLMRTGYIPVNRQRIFRAMQAEPKECGVWKEGSMVLCQFEVFFPWVVSLVSGVALAEARRQVKDMARQLTKRPAKKAN